MHVTNEILLVAEQRTRKYFEQSIRALFHTKVNGELLCADQDEGYALYSLVLAIRLCNFLSACEDKDNALLGLNNILSYHGYQLVRSS